MLQNVSELNFFLWLNSVPLYGYVTYFTHSCFIGNLSCFHLLAAMNYAAVNIGVQALLLLKCLDSARFGSMYTKVFGQHANIKF